MFSSIDIVSITIIYIVVFLTLSFCVLYFLKINLELEEKEKELKKYIELKEQSYEEIVSSAQEMRKLSHDIKNHNNILGMLLRDQKVEEAINYLDTIGQEVEIRNKLKFCKNLILNSVIRSKIGEFAKNEINFTYDLKIYKEIKMTDFDIVTLFMNLLDNAIEACKKVEKNRFINLKIKTIENKMMVEIGNSSDIKEDCVYQNIMTSKNDKAHHGFGTKNIKDVVHKYSGNVRFTNDNYKFKVVLYINI
ncbi:MAG: sensor histidine kinase [Sarcina sp.]